MISYFKKSDTIFYVLEHKNSLSETEISKLCWILGDAIFLKEKKLLGKFVGPRVEMTTPWSTNAVEITKNIGVDEISRIEILKLNKENYDSMIESFYNDPDEEIFKLDNIPEEVRYIDNIESYNSQEGLALNSDEINYLNDVSKRLKRKLTDSEVFGFSQVNSEHCRHKIFNGKFIIDDKEMDSSLFDMIKLTSKKIQKT